MHNNIGRTIRAGEFDEFDKKLQLLKVGDIEPTAIIDGQGTVRVTGSSPRLYFSVPNRNVKMSAEVLVEGDVEIAHLIVRSNHEERPNGHGGSYFYVNMKDQKAYFKVEETHEKGYSPRLNEASIKFTPKVWHKLEMSARDEGDGVRLTGIFDKESSNSTRITTLIAEKRFIYQGIGKWCFIRTNKPDGVKYRNITIEEI